MPELTSQGRQLLRHMIRVPHFYDAITGLYATRDHEPLSKHVVTKQFVDELTSTGLARRHSDHTGIWIEVTPKGLLAATKLDLVQLYLMDLVRREGFVVAEGRWTTATGKSVRDVELRELADAGLVRVSEQGVLELTDGGVDALLLCEINGFILGYTPEKLEEVAEQGREQRFPPPAREPETEHAPEQRQAVADAEAAGLRELETAEAMFLLGVRAGIARLLGGTGTWSVSESPAQEYQIEENDRESRFPGLTTCINQGERSTLSLTTLGHDTLAAWETSRKLEDLSNNSDPLLGGRVYRVPVDEGETQKSGGFPVDGSPDEVEYEELAAAASRALWLSGVRPADKKAVFTHAQLVDGLGMLPTGVKITRHHCTVKDRD